jgi:hypothetical protein
MTTQNEALKSAVKKAVLHALAGYLVPPRRIVKAINDAIDAAAAQNPMDLLEQDLQGQYDAAAKLAVLYDEDDRQDIKIDVMNSFYAGIQFARSAPLPQGEQDLMSWLKEAKLSVFAEYKDGDSIGEKNSHLLRFLDKHIAAQKSPAPARPVALSPAPSEQDKVDAELLDWLAMHGSSVRRANNGHKNLLVWGVDRPATNLSIGQNLRAAIADAITKGREPAVQNNQEPTKWVWKLPLS